MQSWGRSIYDRVMIGLRADEELKDIIVVAMPRLVDEGFNMCSIPEVSRQEVSNSNPFDALNSIENDDDLGKLLLVDDDGKPLPKVVSTVNVDSDSEVEEEFDEYTTFMASTGLKRGSDSGYGTNSLWEQWKETKQDDDYDRYDDDLYDSHDMYDNLHAICAEFDIEIPGGKKK
ncbi:hypothetical protein Tco_0988567 [Tanacetum coccineum]|uniref:Uncharacterized protein n=1 Tax=Tanacetum coccineum TaxID=301880 RepID=A0ABQ5ERS1_9ASTR